MDQYEQVYKYLTIMTPKQRQAFDEESVSLNRAVIDLAELLKDRHRLDCLDNVTQVSILARIQAMLLLSCFRIINRITPMGAGHIARIVRNRIL